MATAKKLPSGSWRCLVFDKEVPLYDKSGLPILDKNGRQKTKRTYKSFTSDDKTAKGKKEAELMAINWQLNREEEKKKKPVENLTLGAAIDKYIAKKEPVLSPRTIMDYKRIRKHDMQTLMNIPIADITEDDIQRAINLDSATHSPKTVRNNHSLIKSTLKMFRSDFAYSVTLPSRERPDLYIPTDEEVKRVIKTATGTEMELPILLAAFGPMRRGEICALTSDDINGNIVHVRSNKVLNNSREWIIKNPKSYAGDRFITYPDFIGEKLKGIQGNVTNLTPNNITDRFATILKEADVEHFRFHDLRHYAASILHALGIPDAYIMQRGGWGNDNVLKAVYRHTLNDQEEKMNQLANEHFTSMVRENATRNATQKQKSP